MAEQMKNRIAATFLLSALLLSALARTGGAQDVKRDDCVTKLDNGKPYLFCENMPRPAEPSAAPAKPLAAEPPLTRSTAPRTGSALKPVRALIEPGEKPPREVGAFGVVAFSSLPLPSEVDRYKFVCEAFKATLIPQEDLSADTPLAEQMVTYWPIRNKFTEEAKRADCAHMVTTYDLKTGLDAIHDADKLGERLGERRGPFLVGWSPSIQRYQKDALVLVMDLSSLEGQQSFLEVFKAWRQKITDNPEMWKKGFDSAGIRMTIRDTLDRYGDGLLKLIKGP
jgi:hypothetical protein